MRIKLTLFYKACKRFCSHYNLVGLMILYVLAFAVDMVSFKTVRHRAKEKGFSAKLYTRSSRH
jgi:hypothetical protein